MQWNSGLKAVLFCAILPLAACREPIMAIGRGMPPAAARGRAGDLFSSLARRVTDPLREAKYDSARAKIANAAFIPSRIWKDTSTWTGTTTSRRTLLIHGRFSDGRYRLGAEPVVAPPAHLAESRHVINLTRLSDSEFSWDTDVGFAIGSVTASDVAAIFRALFAAAEGRRERDVRADYRAVTPRATAALGLLFRLDSIKTSHLPDRSTLTTFATTLTPAAAEARFPTFARYLRRYAQTARVHGTLTDRQGAVFLDCSLRDGTLTLRVRTLAGALVPISGPSRPIPDSLTLNGDFTMKVRRFTVGFRNYHGDFSLIRTDEEAAWNLVSRSEPVWVLPLVTERLLRAPLRRPFRGNGASFRIGVRNDSTGGPAVLYRRLHLEVQESAILRFIGRLGAIAVSDYSGDAEREQYIWLKEVFDGLLADIRAFPSP
jgi:hypothetical protein